MNDHSVCIEARQPRRYIHTFPTSSGTRTQGPEPDGDRDPTLRSTKGISKLEHFFTLLYFTLHSPSKPYYRVAISSPNELDYGRHFSAVLKPFRFIPHPTNHNRPVSRLHPSHLSSPFPAFPYFDRMEHIPVTPLQRLPSHESLHGSRMLRERRSDAVIRGEDSTSTMESRHFRPRENHGRKHLW